ncbi:low-density lipoprotein receptor-like protein [Leptotrombidium deliense]|uniref:Low-density lipoprotein receptor-like protein n=1 Tax=Leptotrombidium deliense TaxID=299467 RepID=A0A443SF66_9ACAR|nr:low-density lipoprotein receptor-like protein [Leptotrombidium deliense]
MEIMNLCDHKCVNDKFGYHCACFRGYKLNLLNNKCEDEDECQQENICGNQTCINTDGGYRCKCTDWHCDATRIPHFLYLTNYGINIFNSSRNANESKLLISMEQITAFDYNYKSECLIWNQLTESQTNLFYAASINQKQSDYKPFFEDDGVKITELAFDWIHNLVYLLCEEKGTIEMFVLNKPENRAVIVTKIDEPRSLKLSVNYSILIWVQDYSHIAIASQDGRLKQKCFTGFNNLPFSAVIDEEKQLIYWIDFQGSIDGFDFNCKQRRVIAKIAPRNDPMVFSDFLDDVLYILDNDRNRIQTVNLKNSKEHKTAMIYSHSRNYIKYFKIYDNEMQQTFMNRCKNNNCSHICAPHDVEYYTCICPINYRILEDGQTCVKRSVNLIDFKKLKNISEMSQPMRYSASDKNIAKKIETVAFISMSMVIVTLSIIFFAIIAIAIAVVAHKYLRRNCFRNSPIDNQLVVYTFLQES